MQNKFPRIFLIALLALSCAEQEPRSGTRNLTEAAKITKRDSIAAVLMDSLNAGRQIDEVPYYQAMHEIDTLNLKYLFKYTEQLSAKGQTQPALRLLDRYLAWHDNRSALYNHKGNVWQVIAAKHPHQSPEYKAAADSSIFFYNKALEADSMNVEAVMALSAIHEYQKNYPAAIRDIERAMRIQPTNRTHYLFRGAYKYHLKDFKGAYQDLTPITSVRRLDHYFYYYRAFTAIELGKYREAVQDFDTCEMLDFNSPELYYNRGKLKTHFKEKQREGYLEIRKAQEMGFPLPKEEQDLIKKKLDELSI